MQALYSESRNFLLRLTSPPKKKGVLLLPDALGTACFLQSRRHGGDNRTIVSEQAEGWVGRVEGEWRVEGEPSTTVTNLAEYRTMYVRRAS